MAEFPNRALVRADCARVLAKLGTRHRRELLALLGDPPNPDNVPDAFWKRVQEETDSELLAAILVMVMMAATQHGMDEEAAELAGTLWASERAELAATWITETSQRWLESGVARIQAQQAVPRAGAAAAGGGVAVAEATRAATITLPEVVDRIFGPERAVAIARNESNIAMNEGGKIAIEHTGVEVTCWWRHTEQADPGHAGADEDPCPICTPYLDTEEDDWDDLEPGYAHENCDCFRQYLENMTGRDIGAPDSDIASPGALAATKNSRRLIPFLKGLVREALLARAIRKDIAGISTQGIVPEVAPQTKPAHTCAACDDKHLVTCEECGGKHAPDAPHVVANSSVIFPPVAKAFIDRELRASIAAAADETERDPSDSQKAAGNYAKGKFRWNGLTVTIENPKGSIRSGASADGKEWSVKMGLAYGYLNRTLSGSDGDQIDVFVGPDPESELVFVIDQVDADGKFDEHKCVLGMRTEDEARAGYLSCYSPGWKGLGDITPMTLPEFKKWLEGWTGRPVAKAFNEDNVLRDKDGKFAVGAGGAVQTHSGQERSPNGIKQTETVQFKAWFGDSKVVDHAGDPQTTHGVTVEVFHGSGSTDFTQFDPAKIGGNGRAAGYGFYFAEDPAIANNYAEAQNGAVIPAFLHIEKPFDFDARLTHEQYNAAIEASIATRDLMKRKPDFAQNERELAELNFQSKSKDGDGKISGQVAWEQMGKIASDPNAVLASMRYDGITHRSTDQFGTPARDWEKADFGRVWIAFQPEQIKSAIANSGRFDPKNPDITKDFSEADHPRGQPGNAGQFGPGGGPSGRTPQPSATHDQPGSPHLSVAEMGGHAGTPKDPIHCGKNLDLALRALADGKSVRLHQPDQVATLLDKMNDIVKECKAKGTEAPNFNLCNVSIPGTNLWH